MGPAQWPAWLGIGLAWLVARLPWALQRVLGRLIGTLLFAAMRERRNVARRNIALCFPELDAGARDALARANSNSPMRRGLRVEGLEHLAAARAGGRGVIVVSGHFTTLEISARLMCDHAPLAGMYRPHNQGATLHG